MKLYLVFHGRFPGEKAAAIFAAKSVEAFADEGVETILVVPRRLGRGKGDPYEYYQIQQNFKIVYLPIIDLFKLPLPRVFSFWVSFVTFSLSSFFYLLFAANRKDLIYSNESLPLFFATFAFANTFYEMQDFPESKIGLFGWFVRRTRLFVVSNGWKAMRMKEVFGTGPEKVLLEYNAVDVSKFDISMGRDDARKKLGLPLDKKLVVYTGHLYGWKGVDTLAKAASLLPQDYLVVFVGGTKEDIARFTGLYGAESRIRIVGLKPYLEIPLWQKAADALALPNTAKEKISLYYTSPMKLFEYMASDRPIVASNILSIAEILNDKNAFLVQPDDPADLARGLKAACEGGDASKARAAAAHEGAKEHAWDRRARRVLTFAGLL